MRILVVEQEAIIGFDLRTMLLDLNFRPVGAVASVDEAKPLLARTAADAVIVDINSCEEKNAVSLKTFSPGIYPSSSQPGFRLRLSQIYRPTFQ